MIICFYSFQNTRTNTIVFSFKGKAVDRDYTGGIDVLMLYMIVDVSHCVRAHARARVCACARA